MITLQLLLYLPKNEGEMKKKYQQLKDDIYRLYTVTDKNLNDIAAMFNDQISAATIKKWINANGGEWRRKKLFNSLKDYNELLPEKVAIKIGTKIDDLLTTEGANFNVKSAENVVKLSLLLEKLKGRENLVTYSVFGLKSYLKYLEIYRPAMLTSSFLDSVESYFQTLIEGEDYNVS